MQNPIRVFREKRNADRACLEEKTVSCLKFRDWQRLALIGYVIAFVGLGANSYVDRTRATNGRAALVRSARAVSIVGCNRDFRSTQNLRGLLSTASASTKAQHDVGLITDEQYRRAVEFYTQQLQQIQLPDCRLPATVLTDNPKRADAKVPRPLYHGSPEENVVIVDPKPNG